MYHESKLIKLSQPQEYPHQFGEPDDFRASLRKGVDIVLPTIVEVSFVKRLIPAHFEKLWGKKSFQLIKNQNVLEPPVFMR